MKRTPNPNKLKRIRGPRLTGRELGRAKVRITTYLDDDILAMLRQLAQDSGAKYQALLNQILRHSLTGKQVGIVARIARLEQAVFRKRVA